MRGLLSLSQFKFSRKFFKFTLYFFLMSLLSPSENTPSNWKKKERKERKRNKERKGRREGGKEGRKEGRKDKKRSRLEITWNMVSWVISLIWSLASSAPSAPFNSVPCPLKETCSQASKSLHKLFLLEMPFISIFTRTTETRHSPPSTVYVTKIISKRLRKNILPAFRYQNQRQIVERMVLERGEWGERFRGGWWPSTERREGKVLSNDWSRDLRVRGEWTTGNLPSSPGT